LNNKAGESITLILGDGIGPEITRAVAAILEATGFRPKWDTALAGAPAIKEYGKPLPERLIESTNEMCRAIISNLAGTSFQRSAFS
jgi:isocitrate/isopropylmalate dehydrogenase